MKQLVFLTLLILCILLTGTIAEELAVAPFFIEVTGSLLKWEF
jgi:hypothetical protein